VGGGGIRPGRRDRPATPTSRREFLAGLAGAGVGAGLAVGCSGRAGSRGNAGGWYAWLADTHLAADPAAAMHGQVMAANLRAVVADILGASDPPRGVVIDGDLAQTDGQAGDYRALLAATGPLSRARIPIHLTLGNHDDRDTFRAVLGEHAGAVAGKYVGAVDGAGHRLLMLDSLDHVNATAGRLGGPQRDWLARQLDAAPETPAIVFVHHHLDAHQRPALADTEALLAVLRPRRQAKAVVFGHTHAWGTRVEDGLHLINLPAVGYRFKAKQPLGWCLFRPAADGGELELRCIGGDRTQDRRRLALRWRSA